MLPEFDDEGDLPVGIHAATLAEIGTRFGQFTVSDRRMKLLARLRQIVELAWASGIVARILVVGSFITAKPEPNDVDLVLVVVAELEFEELKPSQYAVTNRQALRRVVKGTDYDVAVARAGTAKAQEVLEFFQLNRRGKQIGIVEVKR